MDSDKLKIVIEKHLKWINGKEGGERANLSGCDLRGSNLRGCDLRGCDLHDCNLRGSNIRGCDLRDCDLRGSNIRGCDLRDCDLRGCDLRGCDLDYSCWPLWCGSVGVKCGSKIARQLAAHFCALICDDPEYAAARDAVLPFAQKSHRASEIFGRMEEIKDESKT